MLVVESDRAASSSPFSPARYLPELCGEVRPQSSPRPRPVREHGAETTLTPSRSRCASCEKTHVVLLTDSTLLRRRDALSVIGAALIVNAAGQERRRVGASLGVYPDTVRGFRRFAVRAEEWRAHCWRWAHTLDFSLGRIAPAG